MLTCPSHHPYQAEVSEVRHYQESDGHGEQIFGFVRQAEAGSPIKDLCIRLHENRLLALKTTWRITRKLLIFLNSPQNEKVTALVIYAGTDL